MLYAPGTVPDMTAEQAFDLEIVRRTVLNSSNIDASILAVKLRRENQLLRIAVQELSHELDRIAGSK